VSLCPSGPIVYLITAGAASDPTFDPDLGRILEIVNLAVTEGVDLIQIREKRLSGRHLFELTAAAARVTDGTATRLLVNDRADIALAAKADGVHLTSTSLAAAVIRNSFPKGFLIGISAHSADDAARGRAGGADLAVFGPVFETPGKGRPQGLAALSEVCEKMRPFPVLALGGVDASNYASAIDAGASGLAGIRSLNDPGSLRSICRSLKG
jgi:thiamine-phosphate pyrophosphorylase